MYTKYVTGATVTDLGTDLPFVANYVVAALNPTASAVTLQFGDASTGPFVTGRTRQGAAAVIPAGGSAEVAISGRYAAIENGTGQVQLLSD
jgi:hypothetical protein